jgi:AraC-like DNA-binding protein
MRQPRAPAVELVKFPRLLSGHFPIRPQFPSVRSFASHNDVALNYIERGWIRMILSTGFTYELRPRRLSVFWGAIPHKVEPYAPGTVMRAIVLPVATFLRWTIPSQFTRELMRGVVFFEPNDREGALDLALLKRWHQEISTGDVEAEQIVLLELEGRLRRLARSCPSPPQPLRRLASGGSTSQAEQMLLLIAEHFREPLLPRDVAAAAGLHPDTAGRLFRHRTGLTLTDYIAECRLSYAKTLLATTNVNMLDVAMESGFGSVSQFHAIFKQRCGCTPRGYRTSLRRPDVDRAR